MSYNLYICYVPSIARSDALSFPRQTLAVADSFTARKAYSVGFGIHVTDVVAIRIREGDLVQVRGNAIAITKAKLVKVEDSDTATIRVLEDAILKDSEFRVPVACVERLVLA